MKKILFLIILILSISPQCGGKNIKQNSDNSASGKTDEQAKQMLDWIAAINYNSPKTIKASVYLNGRLKRKTYKSTGYTRFNKATAKMIISFVDYVFKSPITTLAKNRDTIRFYFPANKRLYIDNFHKLNLYMYTGFNIDFHFLYSLATGRIPLLANYSVKSVKGSYLILENNTYFETISFKKKIPDKILLINKKNKERFEFYLGKITRSKGSMFFKRIKVVSQRSQLVFNFYFSNVRLNTPVKVNANFYVPQNVKITRVN